LNDERDAERLAHWGRLAQGAILDLRRLKLSERDLQCFETSQYAKQILASHTE
jgi:hypothetical protein